MNSTTEALKKRAKGIIKASLPKTLMTVEIQRKSISEYIERLNKVDADTDDIDELIRKLEAKLDDLGSLAGSLTQTVESSGTNDQNNHSTGSGEKMVDLKIDKLMGDNWIMWKEQIIAKLTINRCVRAIEEKTG